MAVLLHWDGHNLTITKQCNTLCIHSVWGGGRKEIWVWVCGRKGGR